MRWNSPIAAALLLAFSPLRPQTTAAEPAPSNAGTNSPLPGAKGTNRVKMTTWTFRNVFEKSARDLRTFDGSSQEKAGKFLDDQAKIFQDKGDLKEVAKIFEKHSFEEVEKVAKKKLVNQDSSDAIARGRRGMIDEAMAATLSDIDPQGRLTIGMLDSGNKNSGIASDVDQTLFVLPPEVARQLGINESKVIEAFNKKFEAMYGYPPNRLGIETLNGADFFPDWRGEHSLAEFSMEVDRVVSEKRKNPEAYRSEGQLKSQAEGRGYEALQQHSDRIRDLDLARTAVEEIDAGPGTPDEKAAKKQAVEAEILKKYSKNFKASNLTELGKEFARHSPWTEVGWDKTTGKPRTAATYLEDPRGKVLKIQPEFVKRFAFDGSWDNWIMFEHHPHNRRKYLLRSMAEGISLMRKMPGKHVTTLEYEKVYGEGNPQRIQDFLKEVYAGWDDAKIARMKRTLDVAAKERLKHKGASYTEMEVWAEYLTPISAEEARLYSGVPEKVLAEMQMDRAKRAWEADARELMIENLVRTVSAPADLLSGSVSDADLRAIQSENPNATRSKLDEAVRKQLFHGIHDLLSPEHVRSLVAADSERVPLELKRQKDLVDRLLIALEQRGGTELRAQVEEIARQAARRRILTDPELQPFRTRDLYERVLTYFKTEFDQAKGMYREARENWDSGKYTTEYVGRRMIEFGAEHLASTSAEVLDAMGFRLKNVYLLLHEDRLPQIHIEFEGQKFDARQLAHDLISLGNIDSTLQVLVAAQQEGARAAAWTAAREVAMNIPGVAQVNAVVQLFKGEPQGAFMMGAAMMIPGVGQAYMLVSISTGVVTLVGNMVLEPLKSDDADKAYQGFLGKESGFKIDERSQRYSLLDPVKIRLIPWTVRDAEGQEHVTYLFDEYSDEEALLLGFLKPGENSKWLREKFLLGGGPEWKQALAAAENWNANPRLYFEAKRASLFFHYLKRAEAYLKRQGVEMHFKEAGPHLADMFLINVNQWLHGQGEYEGKVEGENELIERRFTPEIRQRIAARMAADFLWGYQFIRNQEHSLEKSIASNVERAREDRIRFEANARMAALEDARRKPLEAEMARAVYRQLDRRRDSAREAAPRIHVRPVVLRGDKVVEGKTNEIVECDVSISANPEEYPPPYSHKTEWIYKPNGTNRNDTATIGVKVQVFASNGKRVGEPVEQDIGTGLMPKEEEPDEVGDTLLSIQTSRYPKNNNGITITSQALGGIDTNTTRQHVTYLLLRRKFGSDRFDELTPYGNSAFPRQVLISTNRVENGRIATNQFLLLDNPTYAKTNGPFQYQVKEQILDANGKVLKENLSNITDPGKVFIGLVQAADTNGTLNVSIESPYQFAKFEAALMFESQHCQAWEAEFEVKAGSWQGHFFSDRVEGGRYYGDYEALSKASAIRSIYRQSSADELAKTADPKPDGAAGLAYCRVPVIPAGTPVQITAHLGPFTAQKTVQLPPVSSRLKQIQEQIPTEKKEAEEIATRLEKDLAEMPRWIQEADKAVAALKPATNFSEYGGVMRSKQYLVQQRQKESDLREWHIPMRRLEAAQRAAQIRADWKEAIAVKKKEMERRLAKIAADREFSKSMAQIYAGALAFSDVPPETRKTLEEDQRVASMRATNRRAEFRELQMVFEDLAEFAYLAGDAAEFESATLRRMKLQEEFDKEPRFDDFADSQQNNVDFPSTLFGLAHGVAILKGAREKGAGYWELASQKMIDQYPADKRHHAARLWAAEFRPAWFPNRPVSAPDINKVLSDIPTEKPPGKEVAKSAEPEKPVEKKKEEEPKERPVPGEMKLPAGFGSESFGKGIEFVKEGKYDEAVLAYQKAIQADAKNPEYHYGLGGALGFEGKWKEAEEAYRKAVSIAPTNAAYNTSLGHALFSQKKFAEAEPAYRQALQGDPTNAQLRAFYASSLYYGGKYQEAESAYKKAVEGSPTDANLRVGLANSLFALQQYSEAEHSYADAVQLQPGNAAFHSYLATALSYQRKFGEAEAQLRETIRLDPGNADWQIQLANTLTYQNRWLDAEPYFQEAARLNPSNPFAPEGLGHVRMSQGRWIEAERFFREAIRMNGSVGQFHAGLAGALYREDRIKEAEAEALEAKRLGFTNHWIFQYVKVP